MFFHDIIYGPVKSRRFGYSLGLNLLPVQSKRCTFNCIYCECGWNPKQTTGRFVNAEDFLYELRETLDLIKKHQHPLDVITFAGNGEPTLHPQFLYIVEQIQKIKETFNLTQPLVLLTNGTTIFKEAIQKAISFIEMPVFKIDSAIPTTVSMINKPASNYNFEEYIKFLQNINRPIYLQSMFLRGMVDGKELDNTTPKELQALLTVYQQIKPKKVYLYSLDRVPPLSTLEKISDKEMKTIAVFFESNGIPVVWV